APVGRARRRPPRRRRGRRPRDRGDAADHGARRALAAPARARRAPGLTAPRSAGHRPRRARPPPSARAGRDICPVPPARPRGCVRRMATLEIDSLTKSYGDVRALRGTSFDVRAGEIFGFVGSNGAGKTTTMRIVLGVLAEDAGEVRWDGRPI